VVARVIVMVKRLRLLAQFDRRPLAFGIVWKTGIYFVASILYHLIKGWLASILRGADAFEALRLGVHSLAGTRVELTELWLLLLLLLYVTAQEFVRVLGKKRVLELLFGARRERGRR
jgi:hypothetical protein